MYNFNKSYLFFLFLLLFLISYNSSYSQINTEVLRTIKPDLGYYHNINLELGINKGNSELFRFRTSYRVDFVDTNSRAFATINYENADAKDRDVINKGFMHIRYMNDFNELIEKEIFFQKEFNDFTRLLDRNVLGANVRFNLLNYLDSNSQYKLSIGNGLMFENEKINQQKIWTTNLIKSNNYVSIFVKYNNTISFTNVLYFQMALNRILDRRFLNNSTMFFNINKNLRLNLRFTYFYDKEPPPFISNYDFELVNGINIDF